MRGTRFVAEAANVVLVGGVGTGKTHLAIALGMACCQHDYRVRFLTAAERSILFPNSNILFDVQARDPVRCANQGCTLCLADAGPVVTGWLLS